MRAVLLVGSVALALSGVAVRAEAAPPQGVKDFDVVFEDCTEYVGIGLVPAAPARALVPTSYALVEAGDSAILVVRVSQCAAVSIDGNPAHPGQVAQVGISVAGLDTSADINNYTLSYVTDSGELAGKLTSAGAQVSVDAQLSYSLDPATDAFESLVDAPQVSLVSLLGSAAAPTSAPTAFIASWWTDGSRGQVRMRTEFPEIAFGGASVTLTTDAGSDLDLLIGPGPYSFVLLDSYNAFADARMEVRVDP